MSRQCAKVKQRGFLSQFRHRLNFSLDLFSYARGKKFKDQIVFEHNSIEMNELALRAEESYWFKYFLKGESKFGSQVRSFAGGLISVTNEIAKHELKGVRVPSMVIANGIDVLRLPLRNVPSWNNETVRFLFLAGSKAAWHGLDIIVKAISQYNESPRVQLVIAGNVDDAAKAAIDNFTGTNTIQYLPTQSDKDLDNLVDTCHVGIGPVGHFLVGMEEACPLKTREYWARGLPFVIGYDDTDIINVGDLNPYHMRIDVRNGFPVKQIIHFAERLSSQPKHALRLRELALRHIDMKIKAQQYIHFINELSG